MRHSTILAFALVGALSAPALADEHAAPDAQRGQAATAAPAKATEAPKPGEESVTLTRDELDRFVKAETTKAVANFLAQQEAGKAQDVYAKIGKSLGDKSVARAP